MLAGILVILAGIACVYGVSSGAAIFAEKATTDADRQTTVAKNAFSHPIYPFDAKGFSEGTNQAETQAVGTFPSGVRGGIIPHHTLPSFLIAGFFRELAEQHPKRIILVGPNHPDKGRSKLLTSRSDWQTPFGTVATDTMSVEALIRDDGASIDDERLSEEHSVAAIMPYIKYYLPDATVVPIILKSSVTFDEAEALSGNLARMMQDDETVLVAAVDFSHYLTSREAQRNDIETRHLIESFESRNLFGLTSDYLDSPPSIATLLEAMKLSGAKKVDLVANTNSGLLANNNLSGVTSYFVFTFSGKVRAAGDSGN